MRKYLSTLHTRSPRHKKHFALAVSSAATLSIFALWSLATFGTGGTLAQGESQRTAGSKQSEVSPFESLKGGVAASFEGLRESLGSLKAGLGEMVDLEADAEPEDGALNIYGRPY